MKVKLCPAPTAQDLAAYFWGINQAFTPHILGEFALHGFSAVGLRLDLAVMMVAETRPFHASHIIAQLSSIHTTRSNLTSLIYAFESFRLCPDLSLTFSLTYIMVFLLVLLKTDSTNSVLFTSPP